MMKTLRLLLMQSMFDLNIANDEFNIKMWIFLFVVFGRECVSLSRSMQYRVRTANKFERRYEKS